jgi:LacI family transcriptional regulator
MTRTVLFFQTKTASPSREKLEGAFRYIESVGWNVHLVEANLKATEVRRAIAKWKPLGCIVDRGLAMAKPPVRLFEGIPVVFFDQNLDTALPGHWYIQHDSAATVRMAVKELARHPAAHFAYVRDERSTHWSHEREKAFLGILRDAEAGTSVLDANLELADRLSVLPKPCGILAATDTVARKVLEAARATGVDVPDEIRVVGINNDEFICGHANPTLTSVHPDFEGGGYLAMATLHRIIQGTKAKPTTTFFGPKETVRRASTRVFPVNDARVMRALDFIGTKFAESWIDTERVAAVMGCSRRLADKRFKEVTGHTVRGEIRSRRIAAAKRLLSDKSRGISTIPAECGCLSETTFMRFFKKETGMTMGEFRNFIHASGTNQIKFPNMRKQG